MCSSRLRLRRPRKVKINNCMANFRKPGTGKKLIAEIISGQSNPNQPWSRAKQEKFVEKLKNTYSRSTRPQGKF